MTTTEPTTNPTPDITAPELPVSVARTSDDWDAYHASIVAAELAAGAEVVTLVQPVPVHRDDAPGDDVLVWFTGTEVMGTGPTPPAPAPEPPPEEPPPEEPPNGGE